MGFLVTAPFERGGAFPIDDAFVKTFEQMRSTNDAVMPQVYFCICSEDGQIYTYNKADIVDEITGKYRLLETGLGVRFEPVDELPDTGEAGVIYLVPNGALGENVKDEYIWVENKEDPSLSFFEKIGSTDIELTMGETFTTNIDVGGIKSGTEIDKDDSIMAVIKRMLTTVYYPTFNAPSASLSYGAPTLAKVGSNVAETAASITFNKGAVMLQGIKQADRAGAATGYSIATSGADVDFNDDNATGAFTVPVLTKSAKGNIVVTGTVNYAEGPQPYDSDGKAYGEPLAAGSVNTAGKVIEFILPFYHGVNANDTLTDLAGMTEDLAKKSKRTYRYTANNQYLYIAYDAAYGNLAHIIDELNYENVDIWQQATVQHEGHTYKVYRSAYAITGTPQFVFEF